MLSLTIPAVATSAKPDAPQQQPATKPEMQATMKATRKNEGIKTKPDGLGNPQTQARELMWKGIELELKHQGHGSDVEVLTIVRIGGQTLFSKHHGPLFLEHGGLKQIADTQDLMMRSKNPKIKESVDKAIKESCQSVEAGKDMLHFYLRKMKPNHSDPEAKPDWWPDDVSPWNVPLYTLKPETLTEIWKLAEQRYREATYPRVGQDNPGYAIGRQNITKHNASKQLLNIVCDGKPLNPLIQAWSARDTQHFNTNNDVRHDGHEPIKPMVAGARRTRPKGALDIKKRAAQRHCIANNIDPASYLNPSTGNSRSPTGAVADDNLPDLEGDLMHLHTDPKTGHKSTGLKRPHQDGLGMDDFVEEQSRTRYGIDNDFVLPAHVRGDVLTESPVFDRMAKRSMTPGT